MSRGLEMLRHGLAAVQREVGETFTVSGTEFVGIRRDEPRSMPDPLQGNMRETVIAAARTIFTELPEVGRPITDGTSTWRIAEVRPGPLDTILFICVGNA